MQTEIEIDCQNNMRDIGTQIQWEEIKKEREKERKKERKKEREKERKMQKKGEMH